MPNGVHGDHGTRFDAVHGAAYGIPNQIEYLAIAVKMAAEYRERNIAELQILAAKSDGRDERLHRSAPQVRNVIAVQPEPAGIDSRGIRRYGAIGTEVFQANGGIAVHQPSAVQSAGDEEIRRTLPNGVAAQLQRAAAKFRDTENRCGLLYRDAGVEV